MAVQQSRPGTRSSFAPTPRAVGGRTGDGGGETLAKALGWLSIGLGVAEVLAPRKLSRAIGLRPHPIAMPLMGVREIASGVGILRTQKPSEWTMARVAGDALDLAALGSALASRRAARNRILISMAAVAGVTLLDVLATRQLSHRRRLTRTPVPRGIRVQRSLTIHCEPAEAFRFWRDFSRLPTFMHYLESVTVHPDGRSHWVAKGPVGRQVSWDAEIVEERENELIRWQSLPNSQVETSGEVRFAKAVHRPGTEVRVRMVYNPPGGQWGDALAHLFGRSGEQEVREDLRRFKRILETGEVPTNQGQPRGTCGM